MVDDVILNKKESIERCIRQIRTYYAMDSDLDFEEDFLRQDAIFANLQRAAEQCIDLANYTIRKYKLGLPKNSADSFLLLGRAKIIPTELCTKLKKMVGFRNVMVHEYFSVDISILVDVVENHLDDLLDFVRIVAINDQQANT